jgi:anti-sigma factor ChrR (cupin superfamily)
MKHPSQATLALHAGGDLQPLRRWLTARHLARCADCREEVAGYDEMRELLPELAQLPEISWNRMAAEIRANIRLGLEAGQCVRVSEAPLRPASMAGWRAAVAFAVVLVLVTTCMVLERPMPAAPHVAETSVESTRDGIQVQAGGERMLGLMNGGVQRVTYTLDAQGAMGARYIDPETGSVTINTVYAQ